MNNKSMSGFTLIELMIVIAIIGILASVAMPAYQTYTKRSNFTEVVLAVGSVRNAIDVCFQGKGQGDISNCNTDAKVGVDLAASAAGNNVASVSINATNGAVTGTGVASLDSDTYTLTPTEVGGSLTWEASGSCIANGLC